MTTSDQYRRYLSQGMTPCEAENYVAEEQEWERIEREARESEERPSIIVGNEFCFGEKK